MENENNVNRRGFLKLSALGSAGLLVMGSAQNTHSETTIRKRKIISRELGKTGIKLPIVSMGVMRADNPGVVKAAYEAGVVHFDTAHGYQGGRNEEMVGQVLSNYPRKSYVLATKINLPKKDGVFAEESTPEKFYEMFQLSLKRLKVDYVDILYNHAVSTREATLHEPILNVMRRIQQEGKARHLGVSTHSHEPEVIQAAIDSNLYKVILTAYNFKQDHREKMDKAIESACKAGIGIIAMKTMAGGFMDREKKHRVNTRAALKWALQNPNIHTSIPGFTSFEHLEDSLSVMNGLKFTNDEKKDLQLSMNMQGIYCQGCQVCVGQCPHNLPIPDLMRSFMYAYGYRDLGQAQETLLSISLPGNPCGDCNSCDVTCVKGFDIAGKIKDIVRVKDIPSEFLV
jgi:uncharacterized protein